MRKSVREAIYYTPKPMIDYMNKSAEIIKQDRKKDPIRTVLYCLLFLMAISTFYFLFHGFEQVIK